MNCANCKEKDCYTGKDCVGMAKEIRYEYELSPELLKSMNVSTAIESEYYMKKTRLGEIMEYAARMNYGKLGIAFCIGMEKEAKLVHDILSQKFKVHSVCCKVCGINKDYFRLKRLHGSEGTEAMCNPVGQAEILNNLETEMNIILGLCIGHDILFTEKSAAPVTTFVVKDRVLAHNPLAAVYSNYYLKNRFGMETELPEEKMRKKKNPEK